MMMMQVCGCNTAVRLLLNPWGLTQLCIQLKAHSSCIRRHPAKQGRKNCLPVRFSQAEDQIRYFPNQILDVVNTHLLEESKAFIEATVATENLQIFQCLLSLLRAALICTRQNPRERINMREVAARLSAIKMSYVGLWEEELRAQLRLRDS
uniref:Serine-threonine/tyrosine-protein kinase catalytic domain-containing protein n=1 Tax=Setaria viridis TaxID=4556 RepID=A0A4U6VK58_SETVI|nr:hypothetical protein SEVIR_2G008900v2 [Setaria viridis]TKW30050.1 hypothetical protein SEVIR_2G008900v2 [Setaria viridis]